MLLAAIDSFPDRNRFENAEDITKSEDDSMDDDNFDKTTSIKWTFNQLLELGNNIESIKNKAKDSDKKDEVQKSFSKTFREINYFGKSLSAQESRRSLYFMNDKYKDFLDGKIDNEDVLCSLTITENMKSTKIDFIRYLSILSQYKVQCSAWNVLKYYSSYAS